MNYLNLISSERSTTIIKKYTVFVVILSSVLLYSCAAKSEDVKLNGISLVASRDSITENQVARITEVNANVVALMPYAFVRNLERPELIFNIERQWFGERAEGIELTIQKLKNKNMRIMLKPHIWLRNGAFTGDLSFSNEQEWREFEDSYREYIILYAKIAAEQKVELFCIGTELYNFVKQRPEFWKSLIKEMRGIYNGKLVYAENWDKVDQTDIWKQLDYIGVDAYFPLSQEASPNLSDISKGWKEHKNMLRSLSEEFNKKVIFTEYGYRSIDYALKEPWNSERNISALNHKIQARALEAIYKEFWKEDWFAGGFLWKWHQHAESGGIENDRFTPQNKPAEKVVKEYYSKFRN